jgi:hypothetical protein
VGAETGEEQAKRQRRALDQEARQELLWLQERRESLVTMAWNIKRMYALSLG